MNPKYLVGFAAVTAVVIIAASASLSARFGATGAGIGTDPVFPGLGDKVNEAVEVSIQTNKETLTVKRGPKGWMIVERQGYIVPDDRIQKLMLALSDAKLAEAKTKMKDRYKRIQVEDPADKGALSRLARVKDKDGNILAELVVGRLNQDFGGVEGVGTYIRKPTEDQSWVASGRIQIPDEVKKLVKSEFMNVEAKRIQTASVVQPDGQRMAIKKIDQKEGKYQIVDLAPGAKIQYPIDVNNIGDGLEGLELEDVMAAGKIEFPEGKTVKTEYRTGDGLIVNVELVDKGGDKFWARFRASAAAGAKQMPAATDGDKTPEKKDGDKPEEKMDPVAEAAKINAAVKDWVYQVPAFKYRYMTRKLDDVLEKPKKK